MTKKEMIKKTDAKIQPRWIDFNPTANSNGGSIPTVWQKYDTFCEASRTLRKCGDKRKKEYRIAKNLRNANQPLNFYDTFESRSTAGQKKGFVLTSLSNPHPKAMFIPIPKY